MKPSEFTDDLAAIHDAIIRRDSERVGLEALARVEERIEGSARRGPDVHCQTSWGRLIDQRDRDGDLTPLALAVNAIGGDGYGCDCGTDEPGTCLACLCAAAIRALLLEIAVLRKSADGLLTIMPDPTWGKSADETAIAVAQTLLAEVVYRESGR